MRWPGWGDGSKNGGEAAASNKSGSSSSSASSAASSSSFSAHLNSWTDSLNKTDWEHYKDPRAWVPPALAVAAALGFSAFYRSYLRRIPSTNHIQPRYFRRRSLLGRVTSVGDGDNFHLYHTPGGLLAGWGWLRKVPAYRKELKGKTIPVRIAGVDAPEGAHFGRPAQPYSGEALDFLTHYLLGRRVRAYLYRRDQYDRVVARVMVRRFLFFRRDVGYEMLKRGLATCYEAKSGAEFGGNEARYRVAEAKAKARKRGLWSGGSGKGDVETPREYKTRMAAADAEKASSTTAAAASTPSAASSIQSPYAAAASPATAPPSAAKASTAAGSKPATTSAASTSATAKTPAQSGPTPSAGAASASPAGNTQTKPSQTSATPSPYARSASSPMSRFGTGVRR